MSGIISGKKKSKQNHGGQIIEVVRLSEGRRCWKVIIYAEEQQPGEQE